MNRAPVSFKRIGAYPGVLAIDFPSIVDTWPRRIAVAGLLLLIVALGWNTVYRSGPHLLGGRMWGSKAHRCDLSVYTTAGRAVLEGKDIYEVRNPRGWKYTTPPLLAIVMAPLARLSMFWASLTWYSFSILMILASARMCVLAVTRQLAPQGTPFLLYVVPPALIIWLLTSALAHGQTSILMFWLVIAALYCDLTGRPALGGACLAGATLVKIFPVLLLAYYIWRRRWHFVTAAALALALGLFIVPAAVFGWNGNLTHLHKWVTGVAAPSMQSEEVRADAPLYTILLDPSLANNQSLQASVWRLTGGLQGRWAAGVLLAAMVAVMVLVGGKSRPADEPLVLGAVIAWAALATPVAWTHYFMVLLFPLTALVAVARQREDQPLRRFLYISLGAYTVLFASSAHLLGRVYGTLCGAALVLWAALIVTAARRSR